MTEISESIEIHAPLEKVFKYAVSYRNASQFIASVTSYDPTTEALWGVGARFAMRVSILDFRFTQELEVVELQMGRTLHVRSLSGQPFQDAKWFFEHTASGTRVTYELAYNLPQEFLGRKIDEAIRKKLDDQIRTDARQTLQNLKQQIETEIP
ncbi:MAG: SRPBCC family protein [Candidatus Hodarchaeota archaeon]